MVVPYMEAAVGCLCAWPCHAWECMWGKCGCAFMAMSCLEEPVLLCMRRMQLDANWYPDIQLQQRRFH